MNILLKVLSILLSLTSVYALKNITTIDRFKRAFNRTYIGFEKENNQEWKETFYFIEGADPQFGLIENMQKNITNGNWTEEIELTKTAIKQWNQMVPKPKFVVICGDLVDELPGSEPRRSLQLKDFKKVFEDLDPEIPLVLLGGNHDFHNIPTYETINAYKSDFGDDYFTFFVNGCMFIVINTQIYKNHDNVKDLYEAQDKWIDELVVEAQNSSYKHIILFQHIPYYLPETKVTVNELSQDGDRLLKKFHKGGVSAIFAGHYHRNTGGKYENIEMVVTSAIGGQYSTDKSGYRIIHVNETSIHHEYHNILTS